MVDMLKFRMRITDHYVVKDLPRAKNRHISCQSHMHRTQGDDVVSREWRDHNSCSSASAVKALLGEFLSPPGHIDAHANPKLPILVSPDRQSIRVSSGLRSEWTCFSSVASHMHD